MDTKFVNTFVIHVYMPTSRHGDYEIEEMYEQIDQVIKLSKEKDNHGRLKCSCREGAMYFG